MTVERARRVAVIGESHADAFLGAAVHADDGTLTVAQLAHIPNLMTHEFTDANGRLSDKIVISLCSLRLLLYAEADKPDAIAPQIAGPNALSPGVPKWRFNAGARGMPLLFFCGEINARTLIRAIPNSADVELPFAADPADVPAPTFAPAGMVRAAEMDRIVSEHLAPWSARSATCGTSGSARSRCIR